MNYQQGYDPYASAYQMAYDPAYQGINYDAYMPAEQPIPENQSQLNDMPAAPKAASSKLNCTTLAVSVVVLTFILVGIVFVASINVSHLTDEGTEDDLRGSGGSEGAEGGSRGSSERPFPPVQVPGVEVVVVPHRLNTTVTQQPSSASPSAPSPSAPAPTPPPQATTGTTTTRKNPPIPFTSGPSTAAQPMPPHPYICTVTAPLRGNKGYLPLDGMCDYLFFDSLYKSFRSSLLDGIDMLDVGAQYFVYQAERYKFTHFGLSFSPEHGIFTDYPEQGFLNTIKQIWKKGVHHFGFLDLYRHLTHPSIVGQALIVLKALYLFLAPNFSFKRSSYYVIGMTPESTANDEIIDLMKTLFTPSMFIAVSHLSYPVRKFNDCLIFPVAMESLPQNLVRGKDYTYGHTVNESLALLREVDKANFVIPVAISFSLKGVYYNPKFADPAVPKEDDFQMFKPCQDHRYPYYDDPKSLCSQGNWTPTQPLSTLAYNMREKKSLTYLTEVAVAELACNAKQFNLNLDFSLAAYDVDYDYAPTCVRLGFQPSGASFQRIKNMRDVLNFMRSKYLNIADNLDCLFAAAG